jgi:glutamine amidotransferase
MGNLRSVWQALVRMSPMAVKCSSRPIRRWSAPPSAWSSPARGRCPTACARSRRAVCGGGARSRRNKPFLGICIGQQMLFEHSEEGDVPGLGVIAGKRPPLSRRAHARRLPATGSRYRTWAGIRCGKPGRTPCGRHCQWRALLFRPQLFRRPDRRRLCRRSTDYGLLFTSAVARDNIFAIQCHPEKSALAGLAMLANFVAWKP